jgi:hypothetical protein
MAPHATSVAISAIAFQRHTETDHGTYLVPALGGPERELYSQPYSPSLEG